MKTISIPLYLKPKTIAILFLISFSSLVMCQNGLENCVNMVNDTSIYEENLVGEFFIPEAFHRGQNFYNPDWRYGTIVLENGKMIFNKLINYHLLSGQLIWMRSLDYKQIIVEKATVKEFIISPNDSNNKLLFRKLTFQPWYMPNSIVEYLQVLAQGYVNLYAYRKATVDKNSNEVIPATEYYIQINNGQIKRLKRGRWALYSAVGVNKKIMKKIVRENKLRIRNEEKLIKAVNLFNREIIQTKN